MASDGCRRSDFTAAGMGGGKRVRFPTGQVSSREASSGYFILFFRVKYGGTSKKIPSHLGVSRDPC